MWLIPRLNPIAFAYLFFMTRILFRHQKITVYYWLNDSVPERWLLNQDWIRVLDPLEITTVDQWTALLEKAYFCWKHYGSKNPSAHQALLNRTIPLFTNAFADSSIPWPVGTLWIQSEAKRFEEEFLFLNLAYLALGGDKKSHRPDRVLGLEWSSIYDHTFEQTTKDFYLGQYRHLLVQTFVTKLNLFWRQAKSLLIAIKTLTQQIALFNKPLAPNLLAPKEPKNSYDIHWTGIAATEIATHADQLDVTFLNQALREKNISIHYEFSQRPSPEAELYLKKNAISWGLLSPLTKKPHFGHLALWFFQCVRSLLSCPASFRLSQWGDTARASLEGALWFHYFKQAQPKVFLTSVSAAWPETYASLMAKHLGIRTVIWHYSANVFTANQNQSAFQDRKLIWSYICANEVWVWSPEVARFLNEKNLQPEGQKPSIKVLGIVMCGNPSHLASNHRQLLPGRVPEKNWVVSIFDVPTINRKFNLKLGIGPTNYTLAILERFFLDLNALANRFPNLTFVLKPKRADHDETRSYADALSLFRSPDSPLVKAGRVLTLPFDIDPYLPIAYSDICIGLPFTSPVFAAIASNRLGYFYDPLSNTNAYFPCHQKPLVIQGLNDLLSTFERIIQSSDPILPSTQSEFKLEIGHKNFIEQLSSLVNQGRAPDQTYAPLLGTPPTQSSLGTSHANSV